MSETEPTGGEPASDGQAPPPTEPLVVGVRREPGERERRVALVPDDVARLARLGARVLVERGAGSRAFLADAAYEAAGAEVVGRDDLLARAAVLLMIEAPGPEETEALRPGQVVVGVLRPLVDPDRAEALAATGAVALSLDGLPRTLSRAQSMDVLTSQANVAGYKAAVVAADTFGKFFPLLITASGTFRPAEVLVLGAGVAGLQAMGTAKRLGAVVTGYDVRPETRTEIESVGARALELSTGLEASGTGGYARSLTPEEQRAQQEELNGHLAQRDVVITTAQVPGRRPPLLVTEEALAKMRPGSVVVDVAASPLGGNVAGSVDGERVVTGNGVTIVGAGNLPAEVPGASSAAFSRNVTSLLGYLVHDGALVVDPADEVVAGILVARDGAVVHPATAELLATRTGGTK